MHSAPRSHPEGAKKKRQPAPYSTLQKHSQVALTGDTLKAAMSACASSSHWEEAVRLLSAMPSMSLLPEQVHVRLGDQQEALIDTFSDVRSAGHGVYRSGDFGYC